MLLSSKILSGAGFLHAFPGRGVSDAELRGYLGVEARIVQVSQVHGGRVVEADASDDAEADAIVARRRAGYAPLAVGVRVADCAPVLLAHAGIGDVAAVHVGWRGVVARVLGAAVASLGGGSEVLAAVGPCIEACCFEVGFDVAAEIARACSDGSIVVRTAGDRAFVDLRAAIRAQLRTLGVPVESVEDVPGCTKHDTSFHSYRRDGAGSGRMLAAIATRR